MAEIPKTTGWILLMLSSPRYRTNQIAYKTPGSLRPGFRDLALPLNPLQNFRCVRMRRRAGSVPEISVFPTGISVSTLEKFFRMNTSALLPGIRRYFPRILYLPQISYLAFKYSL